VSGIVAILGRPNVGKSTLFNRLVGRRLAIVDDTPGVTRDWRSGDARLGGLSFTVMDTAGLEDSRGPGLATAMRKQTEQALGRADVVLFLIDAREGVTPMDRHFGSWLRELGRPVILVANKAEGRVGSAGAWEAFELGLGDPVPISAEHGEGMADLVEALLPYLEPESQLEAGSAAEDAADHDMQSDSGTDTETEAEEDAKTDSCGDADRPITLAIVGRPNVGKSTLLNQLLGETRVLVGPEPGVTRDSIAVPWTWQDRRMLLADTAGLRRRARIDAPLEKLAVADTLRAIRLSNVAVLVLDGPVGLDRQDLVIARRVIEEGRALVIALNKWDAVETKPETLTAVQARLGASLAQARGVTMVPISALTGAGLTKLMNAVGETYDLWNRRVSTAKLNQWLANVQDRHPPPLVEGRRIKLRYMTQVKARPPTFAVWVNKPLALPDAYRRYLIQGLRDSFGLLGVPVRLLLRKGENPYAG